MVKIDKAEVHPLLKSLGNKPRRGRVFECPVCHKEAYKSESNFRANRTSYCSKECAFQGLYKSKPKKCTVCSKVYRTPVSQEKWRGESKYCSKKCKGLAQKVRYQKARSERTKYPKQMKTYKKWVWKHFSDYIRNRDNWTCFTCGKYQKGPTMHAGHFISRGRSATMFDEKNVHAQCYGCNIGKKGNGGEYAYRIIKIYGQEVLDDLVLRSRQTHKFTFEELEEIYQSSKQKLKDFGIDS